MKPAQFALVGLVSAIVAALQPQHALAVSTGSEAVAACDRDVARLRAALKADPVKRAERAVAAGDLKYLGVHGYTITYPAIDNAVCVRKGNLGRAIEGTDDALCSGEHMELQRKAVAFATAYNAAVAAERKKRQLLTCR